MFKTFIKDHHGLVEVLKKTGFVAHSQFSLGFDEVLCDLKSQQWPNFQGAVFKLEKDFAHLQMMLLNYEASFQ